MLVDTGYAGPLSLPATVAISLGFQFVMNVRVPLADGSVGTAPVVPGEVLWDGAWRPVNALAMGSTPLLGMGLLDGHALRVACTVGGAVEITPPPAGAP